MQQYLEDLPVHRNFSRPSPFTHAGQFGSSSGLAGGRRPLRSSISGGPSPLPCGERRVISCSCFGS
jgi:hypothetical protein